MGKETPAVVSIRQRWSTQEPGRVAASTPSGSAAASAISSPQTVSSSEAGSRDSMSLRTGWPVVKDFPRSPEPRSRRYRPNWTGKLLSRPRLRRISSMACWLAAGPAKKAAGSPGSARVSRNVTTIPPASPGAAASSRRPMSFPMGPRGSVLGERAEVELAVEPVLVAGDTLLHRHVEVRLVERHPRHLQDGEPGELAHEVRILLRIRFEARRVDQLVHLGVLVGHGVEDRVLAVVVPEEEVLRVVEPPPEGVHVERHLLLEHQAPPVGARHLVDGRLDPDLA